MLRISEINTKTEFFNMKGYWDQTLTTTIDNNVFLTWEKTTTSASFLRNDFAIKILCTTEGNEIISIAPFRVTHKGLRSHFGDDFLEPLAEGKTDCERVKVAQEEDLCLHQFVPYIISQKDGDFKNFRDLPQFPSLGVNENSREISKLEIEKGIICPFIAVPNSTEKLESSLKSKFQKKLKNNLKELEKQHGKVELKLYQDIGSLEQAMDVFFNLHRKKSLSKGDLGRFEKKKAREITFQTAKYFAEKDLLRLYFLTVNNKPIAVELNLEYEGKMYCHFKSFDPNYSKYRVGNLLTLKVLEECIAKGIVEYNFMQGAKNYKYEWTNKFRRTINIKLVKKKTSAHLIDVGFKILNKSKIDSLLTKYALVLSSIRYLFKKF